MDFIRSVLQPVTHGLPTPIRDFGVALLGAPCYQSVVLDMDETDTECVQLAVSKAIGVAIVAASALVKVPQIINLVRSRSAAGVSFLSYLLETTSYLVSLAYNVRNGFPFSTFGETAFILMQNVAISLLVLQYSGQPAAAALAAALLSMASASLFSTAVTMSTLGYLQACAGMLGVVSKIPQIIAVWQQGSTGQLSGFAVFNYLLGSLMRIFTTLQEVDDKLILYNFMAGFVLNAVLAAQFVYYRNAPAPAPAPAAAAAPSAAKTPSQQGSPKAVKRPTRKA